MLYSALAPLFALVLDVLALLRRSDPAKDLEILALRGCTAHPSSAWVTQQARNLVWSIQVGSVPARYLIHDRGATFAAAFDRAL